MAVDGTNLQPDPAHAAAQRIRHAGLDWSTTWQAQGAAIASAEAANPFGNDDLGAQLRANYDPASTALKPAAKTVEAGFTTLADGIDGSVLSVVEQDAANAQGFKA